MMLPDKHSNAKKLGEMLWKSPIQCLCVLSNKTGSMSESALSPKLNVHFKNDERTTTSVSINRIWRAPSMAEFRNLLKLGQTSLLETS